VFIWSFQPVHLFHVFNLLQSQVDHFFWQVVFLSAILVFFVLRLAVSNVEFLFLFVKFVMFTYFGPKFLIVRHAAAVREGKFL